MSILLHEYPGSPASGDNTPPFVVRHDNPVTATLEGSPGVTLVAEIRATEGDWEVVQFGDGYTLNSSGGRKALHFDSPGYYRFNPSGSVTNPAKIYLSVGLNP